MMRPQAATAGLALVALTVACREGTVPYFTAPTSVSNSPTGVQNAITGLIGGMRNNQGIFEYLGFAGGFARDAGFYLASEPVLLTAYTGAAPLNPATEGARAWSYPFQYALQANQIVATLSQVGGYSPAQVAAIKGITQTLKALNFMYEAEMRDTLGIPIYAIQSGATSPPYCNKDVWRYIVAVLDSGLADLNTAGAIPLPVTLPAGFASVGATAAPSTTLGTFAAFNRALAGKAGLELAYAIARSTSATSPTPSSAGLPDVAALARADSALANSALYNLSAIAPPVPGSFALDPYGVYQTYSGQSGDVQNPVSGYYGQIAPMQDLLADVDSATDLRWKNKFVPNPLALQLPGYALAAAQMSYLPYASVSSPIPIMRAEELALVRAEIRLGLGDYPGAISLINTVHTQAGGMSPLTIAGTYTAVRDTLMKEIRISTVLEGSADHMIAIRMWGMEAVSDTTWAATSGPDALAIAAVTSASGAAPGEYHTTVAPIPAAEVEARGGSYTLTCP